MNNRVLVKIENHIAHVSINRASKMNALDQSAFEQLSAVGESLKSDTSVRVVVLSGEGEHFCAGADTQFLQQMTQDGEQFQQRALKLKPNEAANEFQKPATVWMELSVPVIAALEGVVFGAGLQIALAADIRLGAPSSQLSLMEIKWGLVSDMSVSQTLLRLVRLDVAKELMFTGKVLNSEEALQLGLLTRIEQDPLAAAMALAKTIAGRSPEAIQAAKHLLNASEHLSYAEGLQLEATLQAQLLNSPNQIEAVLAQMQQRTAHFQ